LGVVKESINRFRKMPNIYKANYPQSDERLRVLLFLSTCLLLYELIIGFFSTSRISILLLNSIYMKTAGLFIPPSKALLRPPVSSKEIG
jgi:hypothetical protein